jgi:hypothetical protein
VNPSFGRGRLSLPARASINLDDLTHEIVADDIDMGEADVPDARD